MSTGQLYTQDPVVRAVVGTVTDQIDAMTRAASAIQQITSEIETNFTSLASATFISRMNDWSEHYAKITTAYDRFLHDYQTGHEGIDAAHNEARQAAGSWFSDSVFGTLS